MGIIWLASYPKSGNTWLRVFLTNYLRDNDEPAAINDLEKMGIASAHALFERYAGIPSSELTAEEIDACRPDVYRLLAEESDDPRFIKVHDAYTLLPDGRPLFPTDATRGVIFLARNPLDVAVSLMYHMNDPDIDTAIARMANPQATLTGSAKRGSRQFRQRLLTWSEHACSWMKASGHVPVHSVRYEDMLCDPGRTFAEIVTFVGLPLETARLEKAIHFSQFDRLQHQERLHGFKERTSTRALFFRRGKVGEWRNYLSPAQVREVIATHGETMRLLGYLTPDGDIAC